MEIYTITMDSNDLTILKDEMSQITTSAGRIYIKQIVSRGIIVMIVVMKMVV